MLIVLACFLLVLSSAALAKTVTDIDGNQVDIPDHPQRIVLGESRMLYTLALLEPGNPFQHIVAWPQDLKKYDSQTWNSFARQFPQMLKIPSLGSGGPNAINPEQILALKPDVVILPSLARYDDADLRLVSMLKAAHIPVVKIDLRVHLLKNTRRSVEIFGEVLNQQARAQAFNRFYDAHMQVIRDRLASYHGAKPSVLLQLHLGRRNECCVTAVNGSLGELLNAAGGDNIAAKTQHGVFGRLSEEMVIAAQPDYYFATGFGDNEAQGLLKLGPEVALPAVQSSFAQLTAQQNGLRELAALRNGHSAVIWMNFYLSPWHIAATEFMAKTLYPQLFADVEPEQTLKQIFNDFLPIPYSGTYFTQIPAS
ncbi:ABC transporter substrate-binding protein [Pantoea sp. EABMAA-21]|uniref:ABC transporter substrate-binding protein n=1 Tax=unclassified Pantoea TaxID=2630326 RepID=UPI000BE4163C|nr:MULTISPECIES: ABC transporter substrate-binding protein [unclassified Pantoea]MDI9277299.1 ABC transporter substrate-binding protein [Pantoea sp. EABMAA-21]